MNSEVLKMHPSEVTDHVLTRARSGVVMWGCTVLALGLGLGAMPIPEEEAPWMHWVRTGLITSALGVAVVGRFAQENAVRSGRIILDYEDISSATRQQRLYEAMQPSAETIIEIEQALPPFRPEQFNWLELVENALKHPHIMLLGNTGDGKTTLCEALHRLMPGRKIALHPHWQASDDGDQDFAYCDEVIGGGRDFAAISDYVADLHAEMDRRAKLTKQELRAEPFINVALDELPAVGKNCGESTIERIISLIFEARKFKIRLLVMAQADSVKILKLEGQGNVRENLTYVRLGEYARGYARLLVNKKQADERLLAWLDDQSRPAMIEDVPSTVPIISKGQFFTLPTNPTDPPPDGCNFSSYTPDECNSERNSGVTQSGQVIQFPSPKELQGVNTRLFTQILAAKQSGNLSGDWIKNQLGMGGRYYAGAKQLLEQIFNEAG